MDYLRPHRISPRAGDLLAQPGSQRASHFPGSSQPEKSHEPPLPRDLPANGSPLGSHWPSEHLWGKDTQKHIIMLVSGMLASFAAYGSPGWCLRAPSPEEPLAATYW